MGLVVGGAVWSARCGGRGAEGVVWGMPCCGGCGVVGLEQETLRAKGEAV